MTRNAFCPIHSKVYVKCDVAGCPHDGYHQPDPKPDYSQTNHIREVQALRQIYREIRRLRKELKKARLRAEVKP